MTKDQILTWLRHNQPYINLSSIGRAAEVPRLSSIVTGHKGGTGYVNALADKHVEKLGQLIQQIRSLDLLHATDQTTPTP